MTSEQIEIIQYHISNKFLMNIDRCFNGEIISTLGFPICLSEKFILTTVTTDFHDEGYAILRTDDIIDAYSKESDSFNEKICVAEGLQDRIYQSHIKELNSMKQILSQLKNYAGFICVQCEQQTERCAFYMGKIITIADDNVSFKDIGTDGIWDEEIHNIPYEDITQVTYGDNYSKMYCKYVSKFLL